MKFSKYMRGGGQGLLIAITIVNSRGDQSPRERGHGEGIPERPVPVQPAETPDDGKTVENLPPEQPDVDPLKRENPDLQEIEENKPEEKPEISPQEKPKPDTGVEIDSDRGDPDVGNPGEKPPKAVPAEYPKVEPRTSSEYGPLFI